VVIKDYKVEGYITFYKRRISIKLINYLYVHSNQSCLFYPIYKTHGYVQFKIIWKQLIWN